jgi:undecaprenyl-diphosphatase
MTMAVLCLAIIQGLAELLPVSSSAHVILAEKWMGLDPSSPQMTFLLVMLHTGTMLAVLVYFWSRWKALLTRPGSERSQFVGAIVIATAATGIVGLGLLHVLKKAVLGSGGEVESLFGSLPIIAGGLFAAGLLILISDARSRGTFPGTVITPASAGWIGAVQGLCLPFRGFSRSGATISTSLLRGISKARAEELSFALAVVLTPPVIAREWLRLHKAEVAAHSGIAISQLLRPGLTGLVFSFLAGLFALKWLSSWLESGRWRFFGYYCLAASVAVTLLRLFSPN